MAEAISPTFDDCRRLIAAGRAPEAVPGLEALHAVDPDNVTVAHHYAVALHLSGRSEEAIAHFDHALALDPKQANIHQNRAIALLAIGRISEAIEGVKAAVRLRPDNPGGYLNLAVAEMRAGQHADAWETVSRGLEIAPDHPGLLNLAAHIATEARNLPLAESFINRVRAIAPDNAEVIYNAAVLDQARSRYAEALSGYDRILATQPGHQGAFVNRGVVLRNLGRVGEALAQFQKGLASALGWQVLRYNRAVTELLIGQWTKAWPDFELRAELAGSLDQSPRPESPRWTGEDIAGQTLLVIHEQGLGDTLQFLRFLPWAATRAGRLVFACQQRLHPLLSRLELFRNGDMELVAGSDPLPDHDRHVPLMSLAGLSGATADNIPQLRGQVALEEPRLVRWAAFGRRDANRWRIGLSWQGNPAASVDQDRSIALEGFEPLGALSGRATFLSLQKLVGLDQPVPAGLDLVMPPVDFDGAREAFVDTAALMRSLDIVITTDTAVAHLAGLMGQPVWLLLKFVPDWRWGWEGMLTSWYPTMRIFRQRKPGDWAGVIADVTSELDRLIGADTGEGGIRSEIADEAIALHSAGRFAEARKLYDTMMSQRRRDPQILNFHAMAMLEEGRRGRPAAAFAVPLAAHSVAIAPARSDLWSNFAVLLDALDNVSDNRRALRFALAAEPDHIPSLLALAKKLSAEGQAEQAVAMLTDVLRRNPDMASAHSAMAAVLSDLKRYGQAEAAARQALDLEPENARFWVQLGAIQNDGKRPRNAADSWERALFHDPDNADAFSNLGVNERNNGDGEIACWFGRRAVECDPAHADAWNNLGIAELEAARDDQAISAFRKAIEIRPDYADAHLALGMALLNRGDFANGLKHYEGRLGSKKLGITEGRPNLPYWKGGDPAGLKILLMAEQGFGDAFQFVRYARWLKEHGAAEVHVGCRDRIAHLLRTVDGVDGVVGEGGKLPLVDVMAYLMSMPKLTGMQAETIPRYESYLSADPERVTRWAEWLAKRQGFRVGIVWQGNPDIKVDKGRSFPLAALEPLSQVPAVRLIALQKGAGEEQIDALGGGFEVERPGPDFDIGPDAFADTAALMMNLDLVVTSDTAVAHLAGALGKPCWVVLKSNPEWRWLSARSDSPWYPATRLFRRVRDEVEDAPFAGVMTRLAQALANLVAGDLGQRHVTAPHEGVKISTPDPAADFSAAQQAHKAGDDATAARLYASLLKFPRHRGTGLNMLGVIALHADRNHRAAAFFRGAEQAGLQSPEFLTNHAIALRRTGDISGAIRNLEAAIARSATPEAHLTLANIHRDACNFEPSLANYQAALALRPDFAKAHRGIGNLMRDMHRPQESLAAFERARVLSPKDADLILDHAHAKLFAGDFPGGFRDYEYRWQSKETRPREFREPRWNGEQAPGKVLLVHGEQGFGDNIQFVRFIDEAARRVGRVVLEVRGPLTELMRSMATERPLTVIEQGQPPGKFDMQIPMLSLPLALGTTLDTIPAPARFRLDPKRVTGWKERFAGRGTRIGLIWQGNPKARADAGRSPPFSALMPLFSLPDTQFVSLQKTDGLDQLRRSGLADRIIAPGDALGNFLETAHAIAALDLVISSCTATLHLAASLGVPVYGMLKYHADWRWLNEIETSPWYPSIRLFRQPNPGDWDSVASAIRAVLAERMVVA
ncbi:tetratricopeptide repeat protein [Rhizobium sp.]